MDGLGPDVRGAIEKNYRADHSDDNGAFLVPLRPRLDGAVPLQLAPADKGPAQRRP